MTGTTTVAVTTVAATTSSAHGGYSRSPQSPRLPNPSKEVLVFVRIARFEGGDPSKVDETISRVRSMMEEGPTPPGLESARRSMMLVDRRSGTGLGVTFFDSEEDMRRGDQALNEMTPPADTTGRRTTVEMYEVAIDREWS
jgi:hypothetical protein